MFTVLHVQCVGILMFCVSTNFHMCSPRGSLVIVINTKAKENVCMVSILFRYVLQKNIYLIKSYRFFQRFLTLLRFIT